MRELIRGKKAPAALSIVLHLRPDYCEKILTAQGYPQLKENIGAMVLNIRYDGNEVTLVTGIAAIHMLRQVASRGKFGGFAYYCWVVGVLTIILYLIF